MKLNHAKIILQEARYVNALRVVAEAEAKEAEAEETVEEIVEEIVEDQDGDTEEIVEE